MRSGAFSVAARTGMANFRNMGSTIQLAQRRRRSQLDMMSAITVDHDHDARFNH